MVQATDQTRRYQALMAEFGLKATRNNAGVSHENGAIESPQGHLKSALSDALVLRGSPEFSILEAYRAFVTGVVDGICSRRPAERLAAERAALRPLPQVQASPQSDAEELTVCVGSTSTCVVRRQTCTVPSRFIGRRLRALLFDDRIEFFHEGSRIHLTARLRGVGNARTASVDYHHVIESLARKPGAFAGYQLRDHLHPNATFRAMWEALQAGAADDRSAAVIYLEALLLAHRYACEQAITDHFTICLQAGNLPDREDLRRRFLPPAAVPNDAVQPVFIVIADAAIYDTLLRHHLPAAITSEVQPPRITSDEPTRNPSGNPAQPAAQPPPTHHGPPVG